jgi:sugar lactone lactonase YvrE
MPSHSPNATAADAQRNIYVADRGNRRIQVFDDDGKFLRQITIDVPLDYPYSLEVGGALSLYGCCVAAV